MTKFASKPLRPAQSPVLQPKRIGSGVSAASSSREVLVVDDEAFLCRVLASNLKHFGFEVDTADRPHDALARIAASPRRYAVLVTDLTMPQMTGLQLAERVRAIVPDMAIILHSGAALDGDSDPRVDVILPKPVGSDVLVETIVRLLDDRDILADLLRATVVQTPEGGERD